MSNKKDEALKLALEVLEEINKLSIGENAICLPAEIDTAMDAIREALAEPPAQQEPQQPAQQGWKLVPVEPTPEMIRAAEFDRTYYGSVHANSYRAMLNAAPQPAQPQQEPVAEVRLIRTGGNAGLATHIVQIVEGYFPAGTKLYTSPPAQRKPLTDEEIKTMWRCSKIYGTNEEKALALARAIEAAHGITGEQA